MSDANKSQLEAEPSDARLSEVELSAQGLLDSGCSAHDFRYMQYPAAVLRRIGMSAIELRSAGYSLAELRAARYAESELAKC